MTHRLLAFILALLPASLYAQNELQAALTGQWVGTLEYRDYAEPAASNKRVKLPTWLTIEAVGGDLSFRYVYDDGPSKTITETSLIRIDAAAAKYEILDAAGQVKDSYQISGLAALRQGRGVLTLTGTGTENDKPVETRTTLRIGRNIIEFLRETGPSGKPLAFRHNYTFVRQQTIPTNAEAASSAIHSATPHSDSR